MANPNISLLGATYSGVSGVTLPKQGGGTATFPWVEGSETKTQNGTYDVTTLAQLIVNVSGGGGSGLTYETGTYTPTADTTRPTISFANTHSTTPFFVALYDASGASTSVANNICFFSFVDIYRYFGDSFPSSANAIRYAAITYIYRSSSTSTLTGIQCTYNSDDTGSSSTSYSRYWVTESDFKPYANSTSRYFRANRNYKWIAVWGPTT